ncbi:hypothetical protein CTAYLR_008349 [Chrysophaeum taylorii]|uniref:3-oxo-5-alpha-steroid 4-dehydrogenase C-terminal domain-containing protein n=1 Tax=Chrysophaeum taylorii TaxID=2483200 RepID=A0AAD7UCS5_9STRA|nr:hypothetical protein CTAYLR_008349 [Chrysophaeum taylorii]
MDEVTLHRRVCVGFVASMVLCGVPLFAGVAAPYGRYHQERALGLRYGWPVDARVAWFVQEVPSLIVPFLVRRDDEVLSSPVNRALLFLFVAHYAHRSLVFPFRIRGGKPTPAVTAACAFAYTAVNGFIQGQYLAALHRFPDELRGTFFVGVAAFVAGFAICAHSDGILRDLRRDGSTGYAIPRGGFFDFVSCANYFGEILEWVGYAIAMNGAYPGLACAAGTALNLIPRALRHHNWYKAKFDDYPKSRRAIIPFVW